MCVCVCCVCVCLFIQNFDFFIEITNKLKYFQLLFNRPGILFSIKARAVDHINSYDQSEGRGAISWLQY